MISSRGPRRRRRRRRGDADGASVWCGSDLPGGDPTWGGSTASSHLRSAPPVRNAYFTRRVPIGHRISFRIAIAIRMLPSRPGPVPRSRSRGEVPTT